MDTMSISVFEREARKMLALHQNTATYIDTRASAPYSLLKLHSGLCMDLFEEIVKLRRTGKRGALATIVHTNGSIPSYESSRMLVREDGTIAGTIGGGCVEADVWAAAKEVMRLEAPRKMVFNLNHEASYDNGLICGGTLEIFVEPILPQPVLYIFGGGHVSMALAQSAHTAGFAIGIIDDRETFANLRTLSDGARNLHNLRRRVRETKTKRIELSRHRHSRTSR